VTLNDIITNIFVASCAKKAILSANTYEDGFALFNDIIPDLDKGMRVIVSFAECMSLTPSFMNGFFWELLKKYGSSFVRNNVNIIDVNKQMKDLFKSYMEDFENEEKQS